MSVPAASVMSSYAKVNFRPATPTQAPQTEAHSFFESICNAINMAWAQWAMQASLGDVIINAGIATGGRVTGPEWGSLIYARTPATGSFAGHWKAVANVLSNQWNQYQNSISVPGLPLWPMFAMVASPQAPPTPNVPMPLPMLKQDRNALGRSLLRDQFHAQLMKTTPNDRPLLDALAGGIETGFTMWHASTTIKNILGTGPVPSFAPPYVPAGPVVGGVSLRVPGTFA